LGRIPVARHSCRCRCCCFVALYTRLARQHQSDTSGWQRTLLFVCLSIPAASSLLDIQQPLCQSALRAGFRFPLGSTVRIPFNSTHLLIKTHTSSLTLSPCRQRRFRICSQRKTLEITPLWSRIPTILFISPPNNALHYYYPKMRPWTAAIPIAVAFVSLSSLAASAPRFHGGPPTGELASERVVVGDECTCILASPGYAKTGVFTRSTAVPLSRLLAGARVSRVSWNDTVRYPKLLDHDVPTMLRGHVGQSEGYEVARRPCSCEYAHDATHSEAMEAAPPTTQYEPSVADIAPTSVQHPVPASATYGVEPTVSAMASVAACELDATTTIFVTETVVITPTPRKSGFSALHHMPAKVFWSI
jgi:hypothetical protein